MASNAYKITRSPTRERRGMASYGVWANNDPKALGAYFTRGGAFEAIARLEEISEGGDEIQGHGWIDRDGYVHRTAERALKASSVAITFSVEGR